MSNRFVEGFSTYGVGTISHTDSSIYLAMLAGRWASFNTGSFPFAISVLPWAPSDTDLYFSSPPVGNGNPGHRFVMPVSTLNITLSMYFGISSLPASAMFNIATFCDSSNDVVAALSLLTTGAVALLNSSGTAVAVTNGPVLTAESAAHLEFQLNSGVFVLQVNGTQVINYSGGAIPSTSIAQVNIDDGRLIGSAPFGPVGYWGNLVARDGSGSVNNGIVGDRRVFTLLPFSDDPTHQGWTGHPLLRFGQGILDNTAGATSGNANSGVIPNSSSSSLDINAQQFTIEGSFRFQNLPTSSNKAVLFGEWDETHNNRSYELYVGGPSLESGATVFRISTDGANGTVTELISWAFGWSIGTWYHVAVARDSSHLRLFINGILQGVAVADTRTYYDAGAAGGFAGLGVETNAASPVANTYFDGWQDEFRLTIGVCRYNTNFSPPAAAFPRGSVDDPYWSYVPWISGWDTPSIADDSSFGRLLNGAGGAVAITPDDGVYNFQTIDKSPGPDDNTFIEADLVAASSILTYTALPTSSDTITVGTKDGSTAAVYTWGSSMSTAFEVLIGSSIAVSMNNLAAAINGGAGAGTVYGTGTTANYDVSAQVLSSGQLEATALIPGTAGNSIATSSTDANGTWTSTTLAGGVDIPAYSQFGWSQLPSNTTIIDSVTIVSRSWKLDSGTCEVQIGWVGHGGGVIEGANNSITTAPTFYSDTFEADPDTSGLITPTTVLLSKMRVNRLE